MKTKSLEAYQSSLITIFSLVSEREFAKAESDLLNLINTVFSTKTHRQSHIKELINVIYSKFNSHYYQWLTKSGARIRVSLSDLYTKEHDNYFIGNCFDPSAMDDLLYELIQCGDNEVSDEIKQDYTFYVARLKKARKEAK